MANRYETSMEARLAARVAELEAKVNRVCRWKFDPLAGDWRGCSGPWMNWGRFDEPAFCPKCGGKIEVTNG